MYAPSEEKHPEQRAFSMILYVFAILGAISQYAESVGMNIAGIAILGCVGFMLKAQKVTAQDTIYSTHVRWTARTISIATYIFFPISAILILFLVYEYTDLESPRRALEAADSTDSVAIVGVVKEYVSHNESRISSIITCSITPPILWWIRRCWYGFVRAKRSEPIDFPDSIF